MKYKSIAVDGPAGAGKSTIVKRLSEILNYKYVDTGAMYRTVALKVILSGLDTKKKEDVLTVLKDIDIKIEYNETGQVMYLDGNDVNEDIRTPRASKGASDVAILPEVNIKLANLAREIAKTQNVIMDGRNIGTFYLPNADVKIYLTAAIEARAKRRLNYLKEKGNNISFEELIKTIEDRDYSDSHRAFAPLSKADDAIVIDTTNMTIDEVVDKIISIVKK